MGRTVTLYLLTSLTLTWNIHLNWNYCFIFTGNISSLIHILVKHFPLCLIGKKLKQVEPFYHQFFFFSLNCSSPHWLEERLTGEPHFPENYGTKTHFILLGFIPTPTTTKIYIDDGWKDNCHCNNAPLFYIITTPRGRVSFSFDGMVEVTNSTIPME